MEFKRQTSIIDNDKLGFTKILIIGAGSIGSYTTLALSKMGAVLLTVVDFDEIEEHNIPNQFFKIDDIGKQKIEALLHPQQISFPHKIFYLLHCPDLYYIR